MELQNTPLHPAVDLGNVPNFGLELALAQSRFFTMNITNDTEATQKVILCPSIAPSNANRVVRDGVIPYGVGLTGLTAASANDVTIAQFLEQIKYAPQRVLLMQISSTSASQLNQILTIQEKSIFGNPMPENIPLSSYKSPTYTNDKLIKVTREMQFDFETEIALNIPGGTEGNPVETSITLYCGANWNEALALYRIAQAALSDPAQAATKAALLNG